jgi:hypothetical protein
LIFFLFFFEGHGRFRVTGWKQQRSWQKQQNERRAKSGHQQVPFRQDQQGGEAQRNSGGAKAAYACLYY